MTTACLSQTAFKIASLVDMVASALSMLSPEQMMERIKTFEPIIKALNQMTNTIGKIVKLSKGKHAEESTQEVFISTIEEDKPTELSLRKKEMLTKKLFKKSKQLTKLGKHEAARTINDAIAAKDYDAGQMLARLYGIHFIA